MNKSEIIRGYFGGGILIAEVSGKHMASGILEGPCSTKPSKQRKER